MPKEQESPPSKTSILDLPVDLLLLIFPYLDAINFLHFTATCTALHQPDFANDSAFWSSRVRRDFRVPNQPVIQNDGRHWRRLYKRMRTQSKIFTWGNNEQGCLGHSFRSQASSVGRAGGRVNFYRRSKGVRSPGEMERTEGLGLVSDLQCGGWSTTLLTSRGALYSVGAMDSQRILFPSARGPPRRQLPTLSPTRLRMPSAMAPLVERCDPATTIKQFSAGRAHVLGLSDSGSIWSWQDIDLPGVHVKFLLHDTKEDGSERGRGVVKKVVGGWNKSAALVEGTGIVVWEPLWLNAGEETISDAVLVMESAVVPQTQYTESRGAKAAIETDEGETIGEVRNLIVLESCVLFNTSLGKVFASQIIWDRSLATVRQPVELHLPGSHDAGSDAFFATDVQGSFHNFAVFTKSGAVLTSDHDRVMSILTSPAGTPQRLFRRIPALQNKEVISLAFGDYHFHALHKSGHITSYGTEPEACGALGLGGQGVPESRLRGVRNQSVGADGRLVPHAYTEGRRVWFEKEKGDWIKFLTSGGVDQQEAAERIRMAIGSPGVDAQGEVSEWIEQEGRDWERKFNVIKQGDEDDGLGAYFALSVSAAGWHSGALVLVNEEMAERLRTAIEIPDASEPGSEVGDSKAEDASHDEMAIPTTGDVPAEPGTNFWNRASDWGRYFLGLAPYNVSEAAYAPNSTYGQSNASDGVQHHDPRPLSYGASPREGYKYIWAANHFPRLKLSNGTEMPGEVPLDKWRYGRPEWKLNWEEDIEEAKGRR